MHVCDGGEGSREKKEKDYKCDRGVKGGEGSRKKKETREERKTISSVHVCDVCVACDGEVKKRGERKEEGEGREGK